MQLLLKIIHHAREASAAALLRVGHGGDGCDFEGLDVAEIGLHPRFK